MYIGRPNYDRSTRSNGQVVQRGEHTAFRLELINIARQKHEGPGGSVAAVFLTNQRAAFLSEGHVHSQMYFTESERGKPFTVSPAAQLAIVGRIACPRPPFKPSVETLQRPYSKTVHLLIYMYESKVFLSSNYIYLLKKKKNVTGVCRRTSPYLSWRPNPGTGSVGPNSAYASEIARRIESRVPVHKTTGAATEFRLAWPA